jgi:hypothetical protein
VDEICDDARRGRVLTTGQAIGYGLIQEQETGSRPSAPGGPPRPGPAGLDRSGGPNHAPGADKVAGMVVLWVWHAPGIALCTRLLSIGNI